MPEYTFKCPDNHEQTLFCKFSELPETLDCDEEDCPHKATREIQGSYFQKYTEQYRK